MLFSGGLQKSISILISLVWRETIFQNLVSEFVILFLCSSANLLLATSVDVERVFSYGRLLLSHVRNRLSVDSTRALLCLGAWSRLGFVNKEDLLEAAMLPDVKKDGFPVTRRSL
jgi:hypothetical protein